jgi:hypothetical protein
MFYTDLKIALSVIELWLGVGCDITSRDKLWVVIEPKLQQLLVETDSYLGD